MTYVVMVDDHFNYMDPEERYRSGEFALAEAAIARCRKLVDDDLVAALKGKEDTMTAAELWDDYTSFGKDPFVVATAGEDAVHFSAWTYAQARCTELCGGDAAVASPVKDPPPMTHRERSQRLADEIVASLNRGAKEQS